MSEAGTANPEAQSMAKTLGIINDIDCGIEVEMAGRIERLTNMVEGILKPKPTDENVKDGTPPPAVHSELIGRLEATHRKVGVVLGLLDNVISRIDV